MKRPLQVIVYPCGMPLVTACMIVLFFHNSYSSGGHPGSSDNKNKGLIQIISPEDIKVYHLSENNYTKTPDISFQAKVLGKDGNEIAQTQIVWTLSLEYNTEVPRGPQKNGWHDSQTFNSVSSAVVNTAFESEGGKVVVTATATVDGQQVSSSCMIYITGVDIPKKLIEERLKKLYSGGATPNFLIGMSRVETTEMVQFKNKKKYDINDKWPTESYDKGSHIGLMQVETNMKEAWNWLYNTQKGLEVFNGMLNISDSYVKRKKKTMPNLPNLTGIQRENDAACMYNTGTKDIKHYYVPNNTHNGWIKNPNNPNGTAYADKVRKNTPPN